MPRKRPAGGGSEAGGASGRGGGKKRKAASAGPTAEFDRLVAEGEAKLDALKFEEAVEALTRALALRPSDTPTLDLLAELCLTLGRVEDAHKFLTESTRTAPEEAHTKYMYLAQMAESKDALGLYEKGLAVLRRQLAGCRDPEDQADLRYDICSACCSIAELYLTDLCFEDDAEQQCERWLQECRHTDDAFPEMFQLLGSLRISQHRGDEAKEALRRAVDLELNQEGDMLGERMPSVHAQAELCKLLIEVGDTPPCKRLLYHLLRAEDENPYLWYLLGQCYQEEKRPTTALKCFVQANKFCGTDDGLRDVATDSAACIARLQEEHAGALTGVDPDGDLTDDSALEGDEEEEEEGGDEEVE